MRRVAAFPAVSKLACVGLLGRSIDSPVARGNQCRVTISPIIPTARREAFDEPEWTFELKFDGFHAIADTVNGRMLSKRGNRMHRFETLLESLPADCVLDGEIVALEPSRTRPMDRSRRLGAIIYDAASCSASRRTRPACASGPDGASGTAALPRSPRDGQPRPASTRRSRGRGIERNDGGLSQAVGAGKILAVAEDGPQRLRHRPERRVTPDGVSVEAKALKPRAEPFGPAAVRMAVAQKRPVFEMERRLPCSRRRASAPPRSPSGSGLAGRRCTGLACPHT
jgi:hypothetical protein